MKPTTWRQIGGDVDPGAHGAVIARFDGDCVEIIEIQPVRELAGQTALEQYRFPFWTREAYYRRTDLLVGRREVRAALTADGLGPVDLPADPRERALAIAEALLRYGVGVDEGSPCGWARDVVPGRVQWWASKRPCGWRFLADEDRKVRAILKQIDS